MVVVGADPAAPTLSRVVTGASAAAPGGEVVVGEGLCGAAMRVAVTTGAVADGGAAWGAALRPERVGVWADQSASVGITLNGL